MQATDGKNVRSLSHKINYYESLSSKYWRFHPFFQTFFLVFKNPVPKSGKIILAKIREKKFGCRGWHL